nr:probable E3 ubiquitin-protein ligase BAH1-like [Ipomoea batatas]GMD28314.1 probable E3 ubiquitin-protein ligase BAH1-like [Ipomoea batatas]GMD93344.1 probable E3 ubiquitin-protein ligase BAH1-like [Ipomoea batatas]GME03010.1 probable E3 ubiquitin-protein ligase BAH1-like [Ipomoea batatas]
MGFGETIKRYLHNVHGDNDEGKTLYLMDYKRLKGILMNCWANNVAKTTNEPCHFCDERLMVELRRESWEVERCFRYRVKEVVRVHAAGGVERCIASMRRYFFNDRREIAKECRRLMQYAADNAALMHKIIHKYNQVHNCKGGSRNSESTFGAKSLNILQSPWLKELGALYINLNEDSNGGKFKFLFTPFSCDLNPADLLITLNLSKSLKLEYSITCPICLEGVYADAEPMRELGLLVKKRNKKYWRERRAAEYEARIKQSAEANTDALFMLAL